MANLRVLFNNAADRATSIAASTTAGSLAASNMQNDFKGQVHRSTGTSVTYTLTWTNGETVGGICLPATNLSATATIRARLYSDTAGTALIADSGTNLACPGLTLDLWNWAQPLNANAFAYGGLAKSSVWFTNQQTAKCCVIDIVDTNNAAGYIDCARLVIGAYWEPIKNADYGAKSGISDTTKSSRNDSGDLLPDIGVKFDTLSIDLRLMAEADRAYMKRIARGSGTARNIFVSLFPGNGNSVLEQDHMIYGKRANTDASADYFNNFSQSLTMEGW